jgi:hypothetical protein
MAHATQRFMLPTLSRRRTALAEVTAGLWLLLLWAALWSWLLAGVAGPAHAAEAQLVASARASSGAAARAP